MDSAFRNVYDDDERARAYAALEYPGSYYLAFRDLPELIGEHVRGSRALDFGCGAGRSSRFLRQQGFRVAGVDISASMLEQARARDPQGEYLRVSEGDLSALDSRRFDLVFCAFTFDNIPKPKTRLHLFRELRRLLTDDGRIVNLVSTPEIYVNEWASFSTRDFPENREAKSGDTVRIVMLDVPDRRPVEDVIWFDRDYRQLYAQAELEILQTHRPLGSIDEPCDWVSEAEIAPWVIYVLGSAS